MLIQQATKIQVATYAQKSVQAINVKSLQLIPAFSASLLPSMLRSIYYGFTLGW
jgi:hypothetical protein